MTAAAARRVVAALALLAGVGPGLAAADHADEIDAYATVLAAAEVASAHCADILINKPMLEAMHAHFHLSSEDDAAVQTRGSAAAQALVDASAGAPSIGAWCDAAYRAYGPNGSVVPDLMLRETATPSR